MQKKDCYYLGTITKAHGYKGELNVHLDTDEPELYQDLESVFIEKNGLLVPFFLTKAQLHKKNHLRIILEDFDDPTSLIGREIYLPLSTLPPLEGNKFYYHEVVGFQVINADDNLIGEITHVRDTTSQDLLEVLTPTETTVLIPLIDDWIVEVDRENNVLRMDLPKGLTDVF
ncbi:16S rRNA processing protein RimM [Flavobacteriaceae bacterium Ap0902]|nr:16S rRNA processing protein RimM [Flavobacteriaceae bacterium Ap0902]